MAAVAVGKIGRAESPLVVVARRAALSFPCRLVEDHHRLGDLVFTGTCPDRVALAAAHSLVACMTKAAEIFGRSVNGPGVTGFVARITGIDVVAVLSHFCRDGGVRPMTLQAGRVRV